MVRAPRFLTDPSERSCGVGRSQALGAPRVPWWSWSVRVWPARDGACAAEGLDAVVIAARDQVPLNRRTVPSADDRAGIAVAVDDGVVGAAEQGGVGQVGGSAISPVDEVVGVGPLRGFGAAGEGAAVVAQPEMSGLGRGEEPDGLALVEDLAL